MSIRLALALLVPFGTSASPAQFAEFKALFSKTYATSNEEAKRAAIFEENVQTIQKLNERERSAQPGLIGDVYGITEFMDLVPEEFAAAHNGLRSAKLPGPMLPKTMHKPHAPNTSDVLQRGGPLGGSDQSYSYCPKYCTPIAYQLCGDCWAHAAVEQMESMAMMNEISVPPLSPQQLVDCDLKSHGCDGGNYELGWEYAMNNPIESAADYPETGKDGTCQSSSSGILRATKVIDLDHTEQAIADYVSAGHGPIAVSVDASTWQFYTGGRKVGDAPNRDPGCNCIS